MRPQPPADAAIEVAPHEQTLMPMQQPVLLPVSMQVQTLQTLCSAPAQHMTPRMATLAAIRAYARAVRPL